MIGKAVSHYKVLEKLGEGGMGVVYRAHDTELDRTVALKFLPHGLTADESEQARFMQEAKAASALNHPNICAIHTLGEHEGERFIDMEFVDGKTLRALVPVKKLQDAIGYAIQIAEALQEAHSHGIVHRDIKADNIMVNTKSQVKVMDFGLAKLKGSLKLTKTSSTIGTLAYMAPEQIEGGEVDARSDIFSFGIVLYEMLTGHLPFKGEHEAAMVYSIMNEEPAPLKTFVPDAPSELLHILDRALEKDREDRYQSVHEMLIDLRRVRKDSSRVLRHTAAAVPGATPPVTSAVEKKARRRGLIAAVTAVGVVGIGLAALFLSRTPAARVNPNYTTRTLYMCTYQVPGQWDHQFVYPGISADGNWVTFGAPDDSGRYDLYFMNVTWREPQEVITRVATQLFGANISPNGEQIMFGGWGSPIKIIPSNGGEARIVRDGFMPSWAPGGNRIGYIVDHRVAPGQRRWEVWSAKKDGTESRLEWADTEIPLRWSPALAFCWSPDASSIGWIRDFPGEYTELFTVELKTGRERQLTFDRCVVDEPQWLSNGTIVFMSNRSGKRNIWVMPEEGGEPLRVTGGGSDQYSVRVSQDGKRMLVPEAEGVSEAWLTDAEGRVTGRIALDHFIDEWGFGASGDMRRFAFVREVQGEGWELGVTDEQGKNRIRLVTDQHKKYHPTFSPDGKWLAYYCDTRSDTSFVAFVPTDRPESPVVVHLANAVGIWPLRWVDSRTVAAFTGNRNTYVCSVLGGNAGRDGEDSTWACPVLGGRYRAYYDWRQGREGGWIVGLDAGGRPTGKARKLFAGSADTFDFQLKGLSPDGTVWLYEKSPGDLWKVTLPDGTEERAVRPPPPFAFPGRIGDGARRYACLLERVTLRLVLLENVLE